MGERRHLSRSAEGGRLGRRRSTGGHGTECTASRRVGSRTMLTVHCVHGARSLVKGWACLPGVIKRQWRLLLGASQWKGSL